MNKNIIIAIVGLLTVVGVVWSSKALAPTAPVPATSNDNVEPGSVVHNLPPDGGASSFARIADNALFLVEQRPGNMIIVNIVALLSPGYVVIHESANGKPGAIIGASALLENNGGQNIPITLIRPAKDGEELIAMLHTEKSVAGFDPQTDLPIRDTEGNIIHAVFGVSASALDPSTIEIMF